MDIDKNAAPIPDNPEPNADSVTRSPRISKFAKPVSIATAAGLALGGAYLAEQAVTSSPPPDIHGNPHPDQTTTPTTEGSEANGGQGSAIIGSTTTTTVPSPAQTPASNSSSDNTVQHDQRPINSATGPNTDIMPTTTTTVPVTTGTPETMTMPDRQPPADWGNPPGPITTTTTTPATTTTTTPENTTTSTTLPPDQNGQAPITG